MDPHIGDQDCGLGKQFAGWVFDMKFTQDGRLITGGTTGLRMWDLQKHTSELIQACKQKRTINFVVSSDGNHLFVGDIVEEDESTSFLTMIHLEEKHSWKIDSHGNRITAFAMYPAGEIVVTGDADAVVRVGPASGEEPHLLFGHRQRITSVAVSPDGKWIASGSDDGTIRLWPMPQGQPFHTLPYKELMDRLHALTNLRVIPDSKTDTGYRVESGPFPGWEKAPPGW